MVDTLVTFFISMFEGNNLIITIPLFILIFLVVIAEILNKDNFLKSFQLIRNMIETRRKKKNIEESIPKINENNKLISDMLPRISDIFEKVKEQDQVLHQLTSYLNELIQHNEQCITQLITINQKIDRDSKSHEIAIKTLVYNMMMTIYKEILELIITKSITDPSENKEYLPFLDSQIKNIICENLSILKLLIPSPDLKIEINKIFDKVHNKIKETVKEHFIIRDTELFLNNLEIAFENNKTLLYTDVLKILI